MINQQSFFSGIYSMKKLMMAPSVMPNKYIFERVLRFVKSEFKWNCLFLSDFLALFEITVIIEISSLVDVMIECSSFSYELLWIKRNPISQNICAEYPTQGLHFDLLKISFVMVEIIRVLGHWKMDKSTKKIHNGLHVVVSFSAH